MIHLALMAVALYVIVCVGVLLVPYAVAALMVGVPLLAVGFLYSWLCRPLGATGAAGVIFGGGVAIALLVDGAQRYRRRRVLALTRSTVVLVLLLAGAAHAQTWLTDPAFGARRDAYGLGTHMDATGRAYHDAVPGSGRVVELAPVQPNAYGPGVGMDAFGRPVVPSYDGAEAR